MASQMWLKFLGTASQPNATRNYSSLLLKYDHHTIMVDCGESTQRQIAMRTIGGGEKLANLRTILITHLHQDHVLGLVPLLCTMMGPSGGEATDSDTPRVQIYGPSGIRALVRMTLSLCYTQLSHKFAVHELLWPDQASYSLSGPGCISEKSDPLVGAVHGALRTIPYIPPHENELQGRDYRMDEQSASWPQFAQVGGLQISAAPVLHRCPTLGYVFEEPTKPSPIPHHYLSMLDANGPALLAERGIRHPRSLIGRLKRDRQPITLPDGSVLEPPPLDIRGRKVVVLGDTSDATGGLDSPDRGMCHLGNNADVLVHESTNAALQPELTQGKKVETVEEVRAKALLRGHSTPQVAGAFAARIGAQALLLNHFSVKYNAPPPWIADAVGQRGGDSTKGGVSLDTSSDAALSSASRPEALSEPGKRLAAMGEIEAQATRSWHAGMQASGTVGDDVWRTRKAIAAHDGLLYEVLRRGQTESERQPPLSETGPPGSASWAGRGRGARAGGDGGRPEGQGRGRGRARGGARW